MAPMKNKKTTVVGYLTIAVAVGGLGLNFMSGEPLDLNAVLIALGLGGAGVGAINAQDGGR